MGEFLAARFDEFLRFVVSGSVSGVHETALRRIRPRAQLPALLLGIVAMLIVGFGGPWHWVAAVVLFVVGWFFARARVLPYIKIVGVIVLAVGLAPPRRYSRLEMGVNPSPRLMRWWERCVPW
jgi:hypothetical protein